MSSGWIQMERRVFCAGYTMHDFALICGRCKSQRRHHDKQRCAPNTIPTGNLTAQTTKVTMMVMAVHKNIRPVIGVLIGIAVGIALSVGTGNLGVGIGVGTGLAIIFGGGAALLAKTKNSQ
jgi:hypothetical protein